MYRYLENGDLDGVVRWLKTGPSPKDAEWQAHTDLVQVCLAEMAEMSVNPPKGASSRYVHRLVNRAMPHLRSMLTAILTGPYAFVRHPMYAGSFPILIGTPLALGSWWGLSALIVLAPALIWRLMDEETFLRKNLPVTKNIPTRCGIV